jgi:23S rRNA G2069 N7-methylase RlmK/C1962 C5-methylase RlmI
MIVQKDSLEFLKEQKDFAFDINFSDPPSLGSEIIIKPDGKYDYKKAEQKIVYPFAPVPRIRSGWV